MATLLDNRLDGPAGTVPDASSLDASGTVGTVGIGAATGAGPALYSSAVTVHDLPTIRVDTGYHRDGTAHLTFDLPESAPWWVRFYIQLPSTQQAGEGWEEGVWVLRMGDHGLVLHETAGGNIGFRLQPLGLAADPIQGTLDGTAHSISGVIRVEIHSDGVDTEVRTYQEHDTSTPRICTWEGVAPSGTAGELSGYHYTRNRWLRTGDNDPGEQWTGSGYSSGDTPVADLQRALMALGYDLSQWEDDGWYGQELIDAVIAFQQDYGYPLVDGEAGPETLAGIRLALQRAGNGGPDPVYLSHVAVSDSGWLGPAPAPVDLVTEATARVRLSGDVDHYVTTGPLESAAGGVSVTAAPVSSTRHAVTTAVARVQVPPGTAEPVFRTAAARASGTASANEAAHEERHGSVNASGDAHVGGYADEVRHGHVSASGAARMSGSAVGGGARRALSVDYARGQVAELDAVDDDQQLANDVTAKRTGGTEYRVTQLEGPNSVDDPPVGVGRYEESVTVNSAFDVQLRDLAGWRLHLGTHEDARYPTVAVDLAANPDLIENVTSRESGDWLQVLNPPEWLPPGPIDLLLEGYEERLNAYTWEVSFNASSGGPWTVGLVHDEEAEDGPGTREPNRADTEVCVLVESVGERDGSFFVETSVGPSWIDSTSYADMFPFDVVMGGEVVRVTSITGTGSVQSFTVDRSMNGIRKSHPTGTRVSLARPAVVGL